MESQNQFQVYVQTAKAILRELLSNKVKATVLWGVVTIAILVGGIYAPKTYRSTSTLFVNEHSIIKPLLAGQAAVTNVENHSRVVRGTIHSPSFLRKVVLELDETELLDSEEEIARVTNALRNSLEVKAAGPSLISISYSNASAAKSFEVVSAVNDLFIQQVNDNKKQESRSAYDFIDKQVSEYKQQLVRAENALKDFKSKHTEGTEASVRNKIQSLSDRIQQIQLDISERNVKIASLEKELVGEKRVLAKQHKSDVYREQIDYLMKRRQDLLIQFTPDHPDVVELDFKIESIRDDISRIESDRFNMDSEGGELNPVFGTLRQNLAAEKVELSSSQRRLAITKDLLNKEQEKLYRVAAIGAELAELNRDYGVTKDIYEDMLSRKERARLSMVLDIEEQGENYSIREPANFPQFAEGLRFIYFVIGAPFVSIFVVISVFVAYVVLDPRVRVAEMLEEQLGVQLIGVVPGVGTQELPGYRRKQVLLMGSVLVFTLLGYFSLIALRQMGML